MTEQPPYFDWHPTEEQALLLRAAIYPDSRAYHAWEAWRSAVKPNQVDYGSFRLFPLLYNNLKKFGFQDQALKEYKKAYINSWAKNRILFEHIHWLLNHIQSRGIQPIILKGTSLILRYYQDLGVRPMSDFDFLVPLNQTLECATILRNAGWFPELPLPRNSLKTYTKYTNALNFSHPQKGNLDLHWHLLKWSLSPDADADFWRGAQQIKFKDLDILGLNSSDELFHIIMHGTNWNRMSPIRWVADAMIIINREPSLDWDRIVMHAKKHRMTLLLLDALTYLKENFDPPIPASFFEKLKSNQVLKNEKREYNLRTRRPFLSSLAPTQWAYYPRIAEDTNQKHGLIGFINYLVAINGLNSIWELVPQLGKRLSTLIRRDQEN